MRGELFSNQLVGAVVDLMHAGGVLWWEDVSNCRE
jgi:hypothetical protein